MLTILEEFKVTKGTLVIQAMQEAFEQLKKYLATPPQLSNPWPGDEFLLYLLITLLVISSVLIG